METIFHFGAAGHPVSWVLYATYGSAYGVALAAARTWYDRMIATTRTETPPGGQFVIQVRDDTIVRSDLLFDADYFRRHQEPDDASWLCQFHAFPLTIPDPVKHVVTEGLRQRLIDIGFLIPRAEWERRYPDQAELLRQFQQMMWGNSNLPHHNGKDAQ